MVSVCRTTQTESHDASILGNRIWRAQSAKNSQKPGKISSKNLNDEIIFSKMTTKMGCNKNTLSNKWYRESSLWATSLFALYHNKTKNIFLTWQ